MTIGAIEIYGSAFDATARADLAAHEAANDNPHDVTKAQVGLADVDDTSDADKPVSTAQAAAIAAVQADADAAIADLATHEADTANPHGVTKSQVALGNVDNTSDANKPVSTATATALAAKAPLASPALTGVPTVPTAAPGTATTQAASTGFAQAAANVASAAATAAQADIDTHEANTSNPHSVTKTQVNLGNVDNTSDAAKPISTATQTALNTGTTATAAVASDLADHLADTDNPHAIAKADVGLGSADNTADADKPVSGPQQTALNLKAPLAGPALTGVPTAPTAAPGTNTTQMATTAFVKAADDAVLAAFDNVDNTADADKPVSTATATALNLKANLAGPTFTGAPAAPTPAPGTNTTQLATAAFVQAADAVVLAAFSNVNNTSDANKPVSTATQIQLNLKAPLASPALTGTPTAPTAAPGTNTTQIATTAFSKGEADAVAANLATLESRTISAAGLATGGGNLTASRTITVPKASGAEVVTGTDDAKAVTPLAVKAGLDLKAPLASPSLTGVPVAPTAGPDTNSTQLATTAFVAAGDIAVAGAPDRPGDAVGLYGTVTTGAPAGVPRIDDGWVVASTAGNVVRVDGAIAADPQIVAPIAAYPMESGRVYELRWKVRRQTDPGDPLNDSVTLAIQWLTSSKADNDTTSIEDIELVVADGVQERTARIALAADADIDAVAPANTAYYRPYVEMFGGDHVTDVITIAAVDLQIVIDELAPLVAHGYAADTKADLEAAIVPARFDAAVIAGYTAIGDGGGARYKRVGSEPGHPGKIESADGAWWEITEPEIDARMIGCRCNHDGTVSGGTDDTEAFRDFIDVLYSTGLPGTWAGGMRLVGATLTSAGAIVVPQCAQFTLRGVSPRESYIYLHGTFNDFFLQFEDRLGLWGGDLLANYVGDVPPPPPFNFRKLHLANFSVFGQGTDSDGASVAAQKGISLNGRHDCVYIDDLYFFNLNGCAMHMGRSVDGENNGFRESVVNHLVTYRCGSTTEAAWYIDGGENASFGPNFSTFNNCECSLSRGDGLYIRNTNPNNSSHALYFPGLKLHGTGSDTATRPIPLSSRGLVIEGQSFNSSIKFPGLICVNLANSSGEHALNFITGIGRGLLAADEGTVIGNMTVGGGLAAIFDEDDDQTAAESAGRNATTSAWFGKTLAAPTAIARATVRGSSDEGFVVGGSPSITFNLRGKTGAAPASATDGTLLGSRTITDESRNFVPINSTDPDTLWDHVIVEMTVPSPADLRMAESSLFESVITWPTGVSMDVAFSGADGGILIEGGGNHDINVTAIRAITQNTVTLGADLTQPVYITLPYGIQDAVVAADAGASHLARLKDTRVSVGEMAWTKFERRSAEVATTRNTSASMVVVDIIDFDAIAGATYKFFFRIYYSTTAAADFKYSLTSTQTLSSIAVVKRIRAPGATAYTETSAVALPTGEAVLGGSGHGVIEVEGLVTVGGTNTNISLHFSQNTTDAGPTVVKPGTFFEMARLA